jgi:signal transduction histidine kinase
MSFVDAPLERLRFFQESLRLGAEDLAALEPHREALLSQRDAFAEHLHGVLWDIPETRRILELMEPRGGLRRNWRCWYEGLFSGGFDPAFYRFLWNSGLKHLGRDVDQRFIHLGYCTARTFLGAVIESEVPEGRRHRVRDVVDKMLDQCLLVATDALLTGTTRCDREVMNGIAHQVRNPLMVIGGFLHQAQGKLAADSPVRPMLDTMLQEARRLEAMVESVGTYIELTQRPPAFARCTLGEVFEAAFRRLRAEGHGDGVDVRLGLAQAHPLDSDPHLLELLFYHLLRNALEAAREAETPRVRVTGSVAGEPPVALTVAIENNGRVPAPEETAHLFAPFYSSSPTASGFGLPIAALAVRKTQGEIDLAVSPGEGTRVTVSLPLQPREAPGKPG